MQEPTERSAIFCWIRAWSKSKSRKILGHSLLSSFGICKSNVLITPGGKSLYCEASVSSYLSSPTIFDDSMEISRIQDVIY